VGAESRGDTRDVDVIFDRDRNPQQRKFLACRTFAIRLGRVGQCLFGQHHAESVQRRLARIAGIKGSPYQLLGRYDTGGELIKLVGDRRKIGGVSGSAST
jgi:hypothetical protein